MDAFERLESEVRSYSRMWPTVFTTANGSFLHDENGREYIDFFSGAGTLNYGHNDAAMQQRLVDYIQSNGVMHGLDMATAAKRTFLERFDEVILQPRQLDYKVQFPGPTGTNAVEAALKLARKVTGRRVVAGFTNAFHGMTLGALSVSANPAKRHGAGVPLTDTVTMPYDGYLGDDVDTIGQLDAHLTATSGGDDALAAVIVETVQAEGGVNVASFDWLRRLADVCAEHGTLLIVDDVQTGCGRTGPFFSFEPAGIVPDIVCLSKSLSGYGLPMALTVFRRELDVWDPGEHSGTFRGNNAAFVTATEALRHWETDALTETVRRESKSIVKSLGEIAATHPRARASVRGRGFLQGLHCDVPGLASAICKASFERGLIVETSGPADEVVKLLPPLVIDHETLLSGLRILSDAVAASIADGLGADPALASSAP